MRPLPPLVLLGCAALAQVRVRIWQPPDIDTSNVTTPIRFWELIELRPTLSTAKPVPVTTTAAQQHETTATTSTATASSSTTTTTVSWIPPTTVDLCGETDPAALMETLKDSGIYNEIYMAPDIFTASKTFPDLGGKNFMKAKSRYQCDEKCERSSRLVRFVMTGEEPPEIPKVSERAWWDEEEWKQREQRSILGPNPTRRDRRKELEKTVRNALRELERMDHEDLESSGELSEQEEFDQFFSSELHPDDTLSPPRERRSASVELTMKNSGKARDILGTTIALECGNQRDDLQAGRVSSLIVYNQHEHDSCISARIELPTEGNMGMKNNWEPSISASRYPDAFQAALPRVPLHSGSLSSWLPSSDIKNRADCLG